MSLRVAVTMSVFVAAGLMVGESLAGPRGKGARTGPGAGGSGRAAPGLNRAGTESRAKPGGEARSKPGAEGNRAANRDRANPADRKSVEQFLGAGQKSARAGQAASRLIPRHQPFSSSWFAAHPNAWRAVHPHADAVAAAGAVGLATFLSVDAWTVGAAGGSTVVVESAPAESAPGSATNSEDLAQVGSTVDEDKSEWMTIGVYSLVASGNSQPDRFIQLAVNPQGVLRGSHYDVLSDATTKIHGAVDKKTLQVAWTIGDKGSAVFDAKLSDLTNAKAPVTVHLPGGKSSHWTLRQQSLADSP